jgi:lysine decarboxylase
VLDLDIIPFDVDSDYLDILIKSRDVGGVIVTYPDYFGKCIDLSKISKTVHGNNKFLIADEAHGSHFIYSSLLPKSAVNYADMVIEGCHKTLPVQTGGCILNICNDSLTEKAMLARKLINTTSPSYITLATLDYARAYFSENGERLYKIIYEKINEFKSKISNSKFKVNRYDDFTKLNIDCGDFSADELNLKLQEYNIYAEMSIDNICTFIVTPFNYLRLDDLIEALNKINLNKKRVRIPDFKLTNTTCFKNGINLLPIKDCLNKICMGEIGVYPPGTALLKTGDIINKDVIDFLIKNESHLFGLINGLLPVSDK